LAFQNLKDIHVCPKLSGRAWQIDTDFWRYFKRLYWIVKK